MPVLRIVYWSFVWNMRVVACTFKIKNSEQYTSKWNKLISNIKLVKYKYNFVYFIHSFEKDLGRSTALITPACTGPYIIWKEGGTG